MSQSNTRRSAPAAAWKAALVEPLRFKHELEQALQLITELPHMTPVRATHVNLGDLFERLHEAPSAEEGALIEDEIIARWTGHPDPEVCDRMQHAIAATSQQAWNDAESVLNGLISEFPAWAEPWNKRAGLYRLVDRDVECVSYIQRTLRLEPRHFGALVELGQLCLRHDEPETAMFALDAALKCNPHMPTIRSTLSSLRRQVHATFN